MFNIYKYRRYLIWGCLTMVVILTPTIVSAVVNNVNTPNYQVAQSSDANKNTSDEGGIKKALLIDAQKQNWHPKIGKITVVGGYALATTYDQNTGGESVLKKEQGVWKIIGGTGGAFSNVEELVSIAKVPPAIARRLLQTRTKEQR